MTKHAKVIFDGLTELSTLKISCENEITFIHFPPGNNPRPLSLLTSALTEINLWANVQASKKPIGFLNSHASLHKLPPRNKFPILYHSLLEMLDNNN